MNNIYFKTPNKSKKVGEFTDNKSLVICVDEKKDFNHKPYGYILPESTARELINKQCKKIILYEVNNEEKWVVDFNCFMINSVAFKHYIFGESRILKKEWWTILDISDGIEPRVKQQGKLSEENFVYKEQQKLL